MRRFFRLFLLFSLWVVITQNALAQTSQPLQADQAFQFSVQGMHKNNLLLQWKIAPGYHLYRDRFNFIVANSAQATLGTVLLPAGIPRHDDILGDYEVYIKQLNLQVPFTSVNAAKVTLLVSYQGCSDNNFCYPPVTKRIVVDLQNVANSTVQNHHVDYKAAFTVQDKITNLLEQGNYVWICLAFIGFGILLAFTPCVLPMIPILSSIIVGQDRRSLTTWRAFLLSLAYVLGMSVAYAVAGMLVAVAGSHLAEIFQNPWVIGIFSLLFVVLALSLFGLYDLQLPHFLHHRIVHLSNRQRSGSYIGAVIMGALSVLIVSPCVTAPLVGVLTFIAQTGDKILGAVALFALGIGMGIPLLIIGVTEGKFIPKTGVWMHIVKSGFGILLLAVAISLLQRILPGPVCLLLWAALLIILAVYLGVGIMPAVSSGWHKFARGLGLLFFCYGVILLVGAALGNSDVLQPLRSNSFVSAEVNTGLVFQRIKSLQDVQQAVASASRQGKPVMLDFYADWCVACHEMARSTFADPAVKTALGNTVLLQADVTANDYVDQALEKYFHVIAPPTILFFNQQGQELTQFRIVGAMKPADFLHYLQVMQRQGQAVQ